VFGKAHHHGTVWEGGHIVALSALAGSEWLIISSQPL
jgi:hypothetical protein